MKMKPGNDFFHIGTSIGANVEEGQSSQSGADFVTKYSIACKEARKINEWLKLIVASEIVTEEKVSGLMSEWDQLIPILYFLLDKCFNTHCGLICLLCLNCGNFIEKIAGISSLNGIEIK
ncbi:MAG TPA: hypothetical protein DDW50_06865 [Firmicutes bacterium]|nr:hypothetical protein [Bacillota bacterium]